MPGSRGRPLLLLAAVLLAAVPVIFGLVRAIRTGDDLRYLWLAAFAMLGSVAVMVVGYVGSGPARVSPARAVAAVAAGAACAAATSIFVGARSGLGVAVVALGFGFCTGASAVLGTIALHRPTP